MAAQFTIEIRALVRFEDLPANVRALMLTKLAMELSIHRCANLQDLARKQRTDTTGAWRVICRLLRQPVSTIPEDIMRPHGAEWANAGAARQVTQS
ncbi:MAG: hypothetical protein WBF03_04025 [Xanthobacteraceae bacterium]